MIQERQIWNGTLHYSRVAGTAFCFADLQGSPCPCGNSTLIETGCQNGSGRGARLDSCGSQSIGTADLEFTAIDLPPAAGALVLRNFAAEWRIGGLLWRRARLRWRKPSAPWRPLIEPERHRPLAQVRDHASRIPRGSNAVLPDGLPRCEPGSPCGSLINLSNAFEVTFKPVSQRPMAIG